MGVKFNPLLPIGLDFSGSGGAASGDVVGPASSTDNAIVRFDSTTGKLIQNSIITIDDSGIINWSSNGNIGYNTGTTRMTYNANAGAFIHEFYTNNNLRLFIADDRPQVSISSADLFIEGSGSGGLAWALHGGGDIGKASYQNDLTPAPRGPKDIYMNGKIFFGDGTSNVKFGVDGPTSKLLKSNADGFILNSTSSGARYAEFYFGYVGLTFLQMNIDMELNYESGFGRLVIADQNAASDSLRLKEATLVAGTVTVANSSVTAKTQAFIQVKTVGGTPGVLTMSRANNVPGVSFQIDSTSILDTSTVTYFLVENGRP